ncbi:MAG: metallophosphoesterase [Bacteroidetes bacterium]|nr:metallophosphoesterase [Bacteroidota bacterium]
MLFILGVNASAQNKKFDFIAFGDMPYKLPDDYARFEDLIRQVNKEKPAFSVHVGDFKSGSTPCSDEYFNKIFNYFESFSEPLIYTPGDNEWTDCNREAAGKYDPLERLDLLRKMFFKEPKSLGQKKITLSTQSSNPQFTKYVENVAWEHGGIQFATIHLVGSSNNFKGKDNTEFLEREQANLAWLDEIFRRAAATNGLVFFTQADMFYGGKIVPVFKGICDKLSALSIQYGKPVLWINGDSHRFIVDKPLLQSDKRSTILNFTRMQVFGDADLASVRISVDPKSRELFTIRQMLMD